MILVATGRLSPGHWLAGSRLMRAPWTSRRRIQWRGIAAVVALGLTAQAAFASASPTPSVAPPRFRPLLGAPLVADAAPEATADAMTSDAVSGPSGDAASASPANAAPPAADADVADPPTPADWTMLETLTPEVQWLAAGFSSWVSIPTGQLIRAGDRVRTGTGASARIAFAPGTVLNLGAETDVTVRRLDRGPAGNLIAELSLASGVIAGPTLPADAPAARVEVETPAALIVSRRVGPRIEVGPDGATHVSAPGDAPAGSISVEGKDALVTEITLGPGEQTDVTVGAAPTAANVAPTLTVTPSAPASPAGPDAASAAPPPTGTPGTGRPATATPAPVPGPAAPAASPAPGAAPGAAGVGAGALAAPLAAPAPLQGPAGPWGPVSPFPPPGLAGLAATTSTLPCAVAPGQICTGTLKGAG